MRLLLVEDSERLQRSVRLGLRRAGYVVDGARDGEEALWLARETDYDVIILDIMLPKKDGLTVLRELRAQKSSTHVLLLTAKDSIQDRVRGLQDGADDYLVKPFAFAELLARVQALCRRNYLKKSSVLVIENVTVKLDRREIFVGEKSLEVLPREFKLLEYLCLREGELVTRSEMEAKLYGDEKEVMSNVIESAISKVRRKLSDAGARLTIITKRGSGYCLERSA